MLYLNVICDFKKVSSLSRVNFELNNYSITTVKFQPSLFSLPFRRSWDVGKDVPVIQDEQTSRKLVKLLQWLSFFIVALLVFALAIFSKVRCFGLLEGYLFATTKLLVKPHI
jgi:hypothetical protein